MGKRDSEGNRRNRKHRQDKVEKKPKPRLVAEGNTNETPKTPSTKPVTIEPEADVSGGKDAEFPIIDVEGTVEEQASATAPTTPLPSSRKPATNKASNKKTSKGNTSSSSSTKTPPLSSGSATTSSNAKKSKKRRDSGTSSEEERWLTAIESGKLEDVDDELKKIKDPKLMTARQRAMYERSNDKEPSPGGELLMSLPTGYREKEKPQTAEDIQKAALKSQKRKQLADEKREKDKKKTMERLLKKQDTKQRSTAKNKVVKPVVPMITYRNTVEGACINLPADIEFPLKARTEQAPPKVQLCGIAGCSNPKVYNCSKTNLPLCSFACYRRNVQAIRQIMC